MTGSIGRLGQGHGAALFLLSSGDLSSIAPAAAAPPRATEDAMPKAVKIDPAAVDAP